MRKLSHDSPNDKKDVIFKSEQSPVKLATFKSKSTYPENPFAYTKDKIIYYLLKYYY